MKSIIFYLLLIISFSYFSWVFAQQEDQENIKQYKINSMNYSNHLADGVEVKISWENLKECESITHKSIQLDVENPSFFYKQWELNWLVTIDCDWIESKYEYWFPFIESSKVVQEDNFYYVELFGRNFDKETQVKIEWLTFDIIYTSETKIYWKLSWVFKNDELFVVKKNNKSNIINLKFPYPVIDKIQSDSSFQAGSKVYIYWKNLDNYDMYVKNKKVSDYMIKDWVIEYILPNKLEDISILFHKHNISSNEILVSVQWDVPYINKIYEKLDNSSQTKQILEIHGKNFPFHQEDVVVFLNDEKQDILKVSDNIIVVDNFEYVEWNNLIYLEVNNYRSNTIYKYFDQNLPYPTGIVDYNFKNDDRIITVWVTNFDEKNDKIYVNSKPVNILNCYSNVCRISISNSILSGKITIKRWDLQHINFVEFNYWEWQHPHLSKIVFQEEPKGLIKYTISWYNLNNINVSWSNIFTVDSNNKAEVEISTNEIKSRLPRNYENTNSSITVSKYWLTSNFTFSNSEINNKIVKNAPLLLDLIPDDDTFLQSGKSSSLKWYGFHPSDKIFIWEKSYSIDFSNWYDYPILQIDKSIETGFYDIYIQSSNEKKSNKIKKYISSNSYPEIVFNLVENTNDLFYYNNTSSAPLFSMKMNNGIEDIILSKIEFILQWDKNIWDFWQLVLFINGQKIADTFVDKSWKIIFSEEIILEKSHSDIILEIRKSDKFFSQWKYRISYLWQNTITSDSQQQFFIDKKIINWNYFSVWFKNNFNCYNSSSVNIECESVNNTASDSNSDFDNSTSINTTDNKSQESQQASDENSSQWTNTQEKQQEVRNPMEVKIDWLLTKLYISKTKKSTYDWLIYFKNLKTKLSRVIDDIPDSHKDKELLLYLQKWVNGTYTKIFKEYVAEQKNK